MNSRKIECLATVAMSAMLVGCQTTRDNSFSEWQEKPLGKSRFNVPTISNVPVTKLEQNERNNGQVQNDRWELACGQGSVTTAYTFDGWFKTQSEIHLADEQEFKSIFDSAEITIQQTYPITSNANGKAIGYYADALLKGKTECSFARFGVRATKGRKIYDNDQGTIDTVVTAYYCGQSDFNMARFTQQIAVINDRQAYAARVKGITPTNCDSEDGQPGVSASAAETDWLANTKLGDYSGTVAMAWGNSLKDSYLDTDISIKDYGGTLKFFGPDDDQCSVQLRVTKHTAPEAGTWFANCAEGDFASGDFRVDSTRRLIAEGENDDKNSVEFSFLLPRP